MPPLTFWPSVGMGPCGRSRGSKIRCGSQISIPFLGLSLSFWVSKTTKCEHSKNHINHAVDRPKMHVVWYILFQEFASHLRKKSTSQKCIFFKISVTLIFSLYFPPSAARSLKRTKNTEGSKLGFWNSLAHFEVEGGRNFGSGYVCYKTAGFTTCCLSLWCCRCLWRVPWSV